MIMIDCVLGKRETDVKSVLPPQRLLECVFTIYKPDTGLALFYDGAEGYHPRLLLAFVDIASFSWFFPLLPFSYL